MTGPIFDSRRPPPRRPAVAATGDSGGVQGFPVPVAGLATGSALSPLSGVIRRGRVGGPTEKRQQRQAKLDSRYGVKPAAPRPTARQRDMMAARGEMVTDGDAPTRPADAPRKDRTGREIWSGFRQGLSWFRTVKQALDSQRGGGCRIQRDDGCTGSADAIDHIEDFATVQTTLPVYLLCDGEHHWHGVYLVDAMRAYNGGNRESDSGDALDLRNFQWSCKHCNSGKSGAKGNDPAPPRWVGACPGQDDCTYRFRGEQVM
jgi:hypothetical protein